MKICVAPTLGWLATILDFFAQKSKIAAMTAPRGQVTQKYHHYFWRTFT